MYPTLMSDYTAQNTAMVTSVFQNTKGTGSVVADNTNNSLKTIPLPTIDAATWKTELAEINNARVEYNDTYTITFANSYSGSDEGISVGTDVKLYGGEDTNYNYIVAPTTAGDVIMAPADCSELFKDLSNLTSVTFDNFNIENATNLSSMFTGCTKLEHIYVHCNKIATYKAALSSYASIISANGIGNHDYTNGFCACGDIEPATPVYVEGSTTKIDHYNIGNAGQLLWFSNFVNTKEGDNYPNGKANAKLTAYIVVNDGEFDADGTFTPLGETEGATPISITPIGTIVDNAYEGTFDGDGHTISGLYFAGGESNCYVGLFGFLYTGSVVKRLGLSNVYYSGSYKSCELGAIAGLNKGTIENCYSIGVLKNTGTGSPHTGGICGRNSGTIKNCYTTITSFVYGDDTFGDGITNCYALTTYGNTQAANFASGEICYQLNGSRSEGTAESPLAWYQNLSAEGGDSYPVLKAANDGSNTVYYGYDNDCVTRIYTNDVSKAAPVHDFTTKTLSATADEGTGLYSYVCDKCGEKNADVKVIKDYAPKAEGNAKNLELTVTTDGETTTYSTTETIALTDDNQFKDVKVKFTTPSAPTYTRQMDHQWGTLVLPFDTNVESEDKDLYEYREIISRKQDVSDYIIIGIVNDKTVSAGSPVFIYKKNENATSVTFTAINNEIDLTKTETPVYDNYNGMKMIGTYTDVKLTTDLANTYFIYDNAIYRISSLSNKERTVTILPFHAYFKSNSNNAKFIIMPRGDKTGISELSAESLEPRDGKYLENGKIVVVRNGKKFNINGQEVK